jgi:hypothetical protein
VTRETAASSVRPGHDRPERARARLLAGAAAAADDAHDRPRPGETSRRVIDRADRPDAPAAGSGPAGSPGPAHAREPAGPAPWLPPCQAPDGGADVTGLVRMTRWTRTRLDRHRRRYAVAGGAIGPAGAAGVGAGPGAVRVSDRPGGGPVPGPARASARTARRPAAGRADEASTPGDSARQPLSDQERAAIRQAGADDARRSRAEQGFPERIEDPAAVAVLAALLRDARPPPRNETGRRTTRPAA